VDLPAKIDRGHGYDKEVERWYKPAVIFEVLFNHCLSSHCAPIVTNRALPSFVSGNGSTGSLDNPAYSTVS
jgi:acyl carrier protein phosphodiesterase